MKHTPGPWEVGPHKMDQGRYVYADGVGWAVAEAMTGPPTRHSMEIAANARLIASAPDLLAACKLALPLIEEEGGDHLVGHPLHECWNALRAAIAKATI